MFDAAALWRRAALAGLIVGTLGAAPAVAAPQAPEPAVPQASAAAFDESGMWIWYVSRASGGDPRKIATRAKAHGIRTVFIKAGDGATSWSQFTPALVGALERRGLHVCAWHYVYGANPAAEARVSAEAARRGAECLVIDAEAQYEGRYAQASAYISRLRSLVGKDYPLGLASFPFVHYHPAFPYSVLLGPGGAEFNLPQVYWRAIGTSVDKAIAITYTYNRVYERPIDPLGQLYGNPPTREVIRFRRLALASGFGGVSWWSWQHATRRGFRAAGRRPLRPPPGYVPAATYPELRPGAEGDLVVWAQQHLLAGDYLRTPVTGTYARATERAVRAFQADALQPVTGTIDAATWKQLLARLDPALVAWRARPPSARLAPVANELRPARR